MRVRWHFVGQLQRNKARSVVAYADVVHSVDSAAAGRRRSARPPRPARDRPLDVLVQVSIDGDPARGGAVPDRRSERDRRVADAVAAAAGAAAAAA